MTDSSETDETYRAAIERRGHREQHAIGLPVRIALMPAWTLRSRLAWVVRFTRNYLPAMATPDGCRWWTIAYWHRLQVGPFVLFWRTRKAASA